MKPVLSVQVITTLKDIAKPISQLSFPAITVCGSGFNLNLVLEAFGSRFRKWKKVEIDNDPESNRTYDEWLEVYLKDKFQIESKSENFFDILDTMLSPNENSLATSLGILLNSIKNLLPLTTAVYQSILLNDINDIRACHCHSKAI